MSGDSGKHEEPGKVKISKLTRALEKSHGIKIHRNSFHHLERSILIELDFSLKYVTPLVFLERYQRIFGLDRVWDDEEAQGVAVEAEKLCFLMLEHSQFLDFRPSQIAAASLLLSIKMRYYITLVKDAGPRHGRNDVAPIKPLKMWDERVEYLTGLSCSEDVEPLYTILLNKVLRLKLAVERLLPE